MSPENLVISNFIGPQPQPPEWPVAPEVEERVPIEKDRPSLGDLTPLINFPELPRREIADSDAS